MTNVILAIIIIAILGCAIAYIVSQKKKGVKCIGCSACSSKDSNCSGSCNCHK